MALEAAAHGLLRAKAAALRGPLDRLAVFERAARGLHPKLLDGARRGRAGRLAVVTHEAALAHPGGIGERRDREIASEMIRDPGVQALEPPVAMLQGERRAELRLAARALQEHHQ